MTAKASISTGWRVRLGGMAAMFVGFCAYFLYDGFVGYPQQQAIFQQFVDFAKARKPALTDADFEKWNAAALAEVFPAWDEHARSNQLPLADADGKAIKHMQKTDSSIFQQKLFGFGLVPVSALIVMAWFGTFSRWVAVDDAGVTTSSGQKAPWASMTKLDKTRWPRKGIAFLHYHDGDKQIEQKILLDDFKFDRAATEQIVRAIEDHLTDAQIMGDMRETERDKKKAEKAAAANAQVVTPPPTA